MSLNKVTQNHDQSVIALPDNISPLPNIIFTDVDDTLTHEGLLPVETFNALHKLKQANFTVIPVTGASAGWCDCLIKTWPIRHIIGENGAITMIKNDQGIVSSHYIKNAEDVQQDLAKLNDIGDELTRLFPEICYTQDQSFRLTHIAFDIGQTVQVEKSRARQATDWLIKHGVQARRSSIHINVWMGNHSKASAAMAWLRVREMTESQCVFIGDSPNDESMFQQFPLSVGVANIDRFLAEMEHKPTYVTANEGGYGFVDLANRLLETQRQQAGS